MRVLIADDHEVTRRGLREILTEGIEDALVGEASTTSEVERLLEPPNVWDLVLLDVLMPEKSVLEVITAIREQSPAPAILILTAVQEIEYVAQTMAAGAKGFIHKHRAADELLSAVHVVAAGGTYLHPETAAAVAARLHDPIRESKRHEQLSSREMAIFQRIALGLVPKEIAAELGLSEKTVSTYLGRIRKKTGLTSYVEIARYALRNGLVD